MSMEQLRKRGRRLVAHAAGNPCNPLVARLEEKRSLRHPTCDQITLHGLADELGEPSRKCRATEPDGTPELVEGPRPIRLFVDQLKRRSDMRVRHRPEPPAFSGTERL